MGAEFNPGDLVRMRGELLEQRRALPREHEQARVYLEIAAASIADAIKSLPKAFVRTAYREGREPVAARRPRGALAGHRQATAAPPAADKPKRQQICGVCKKPGHNARSCPDRVGTAREAETPPAADEPPASDGDDDPDVFPRSETIKQQMRALGYVRGVRPPILRLPVARPRVRGDCESNGMRPCPFYGCSMNLRIWNVSSIGTIRYAHKGKRLPASCANDVADEGPHTLEQVAKILGITRERVRQYEAKALKKLKAENGAELVGPTEPVAGPVL